MENVFLHLLNMSLTAGILVVAVLLLRLVFHKAPRWIHVLLWALVAVRLLCPFTIESSLSLMPDTPAVSVPAPAPAPDTPPVENSAPDTPVVTPPVTDTPVVTPPVVIPPATDTPVVTPPVADAPVVTPTPDASVSTATTEASVDPWQIALTVATYVWLAGIVLLAAYAVFTTLRLRRQVGEAAHLSDNLWQCDHLRSPFILGVFRPRIYLPSDLNATARASVVAHEQAHLHRRDHWWKPLGFVLLTVYWFNPLMWVAYIFLCRDIEAACDERVVRDMPAADRKAYSEALLACSAPRRLVSACPLAFGETSVKSRVKSVLSYKKPTIWIIVAALLVSTVAGVCLLTDPKSDDTDKPAVTDTDDDPDAEPQYAVFTHVQQPYAQVTLEIGGNRCTYTNSALSSAMLLEGTYEMGEDTVTMTFPDDAMTLLFDGDLTGLTLRIGKGGSLMSYEQMSFGDYTLKDGAVFERKDKIHAVSFTAPVTFAAGQVQMTEEQRNTLYNQYQYRTGNYSDKDRPIIPITSRAELDAFLDDYIIESKAELVSGYDDAFFTDRMLLAVYHRDSSGSLKPKIAAVMYNGTELVTVQVDVYEPSHVDFATGHWFMLAEVPLAEIKGATAYRAVIRYRIPTENYWATYSHPITVGGDEDVAFIGYYSLSEDSRETLLPLVEGLEWYSAEGGVDTGFAAIANFSFDGAKNYYLSPDKKQLYNGEQIADLTAEESEQLDYYLCEGNPGEDAIAASVTGTVVEWSKEGGYLVLEVTDSDSKLGPRVKVYTGILLPGSAPAVGYSATIYYDGWYDGTAIYAIDRKWADADLMGGPDDEPSDPTTGTTKPTTPTTKPSTPSLTAPSTDIATCVDGNYYYFVQPNEKVLYRRDLTVKDPSAPNALKKITDFLGCSNLRVKDGRIFYLKGHNLYSCRDDGSDVRLIDGDDDVLSFDIAGAWIFSVKKHMSVNREKLFIYRTDGSQRQQLTMGTVGGGAYITIYGFNRGKCYLKMESYGYTGSDIPSSSNDLTYQTFTGTYTVDYRTDSPKMEEVDLGWELEWYSSAEDNSLHNDYFSAYVYKQHRFYNIQTGEEILSSGSPGERLNDYTVRLVTDNHGSGASLMFTDYKGKAIGVPIPYVMGTTYDYTSLRPEINLLGNMACVYQKNTTTGANRMLLVGADGSSFILYTHTVDVGITHTVETGISEEEREMIFGTASIKRFNNRAALVEFLTYYQKAGTAERWKISDFDCFNDAFFADNAVLLTCYTTVSGSDTPYVVSYTYEDSKLRVGLDVYTPAVGDTGIANWWLFSGIAKVDLVFVTHMESYVRATIPENYYAAVFNQLTEYPDKAVERWRKFLRDDEDMEELWLLWEQWDKENRWVDATSVNRAFLFEGAINLGKHTYYVTSDHTALLRDDGKLIWLTQEESDLVQRVITAAAEG